MERKWKSNRKGSQNQETNTEQKYQGSKMPPPPALKRNTMPMKQMCKTNSTTKARPGLLVDTTTRTCIREEPKNQEQQPTKDQHSCQEKQAKSKETHYKCLVHACPSLSMELLSRVPSYLDNRYTPQPRHAHHLPPLASKVDKKEQKADPGGADGDVLYKNAKFSFDSSICRSFSDSDRSTKRTVREKIAPQKSGYIEAKESSPLVKSAREHCRQMNARFKAKYAAKPSESDSFADTRKTLISGKSAGDLRSVVRSQIQVQELVDQSKRKFKKAADKRFEALSSLSEFSIKSRPEEQDSQLDRLEDNQQNDIKQGKLMLSVSVEEMVSTKLIAPVVRKVQRMYLGTLREEMSIIEDLERLPCQVSSVFQTADDQKKLKNK
ncbi:hypothetical protein ACLKA7_003824 [Drosophila subpalustris]